MTSTDGYTDRPTLALDSLDGSTVILSTWPTEAEAEADAAQPRHRYEGNRPSRRTEHTMVYALFTFNDSRFVDEYATEAEARANQAAMAATVDTFVVDEDATPQVTHVLTDEARNLTACGVLAHGWDDHPLSDAILPGQVSDPDPDGRAFGARVGDCAKCCAALGRTAK